MANKRGRPTIMTPENIKTLEEAFLNGANDKEAIFLATISSATFYNYCQEHPEFVERIEGLRNMPKYKAKMNIVDKINKGSVFESQWYLERKAKDEFATRSEVTGKDGKDFIPDEEIRQKSKQAISEILNK